MNHAVFPYDKNHLRSAISGMDHLTREKKGNPAPVNLESRNGFLTLSAQLPGLGYAEAGIQALTPGEGFACSCPVDRLKEAAARWKARTEIRYFPGDEKLDFGRVAVPATDFNNRLYRPRMEWEQRFIYSAAVEINAAMDQAVRIIPVLDPSLPRCYLLLAWQNGGRGSYVAMADGFRLNLRRYDNGEISDEPENLILLSREQARRVRDVTRVNDFVSIHGGADGSGAPYARFLMENRYRFEFFLRGREGVSHQRLTRLSPGRTPLEATVTGQELKGMIGAVAAAQERDAKRYRARGAQPLVRLHLEPRDDGRAVFSADSNLVVDEAGNGFPESARAETTTSRFRADLPAGENPRAVYISSPIARDLVKGITDDWEEIRIGWTDDQGVVAFQHGPEERVTDLLMPVYIPDNRGNREREPVAAAAD